MIIREFHVRYKTWKLVDIGNLRVKSFQSLEIKNQKLVLESLRQGIFTQPVQQKEQHITVPWKIFPNFLQHDLKCDHFFIKTTENDLSGVSEIFGRTENNPYAFERLQKTRTKHLARSPFSSLPTSN